MGILTLTAQRIAESRNIRKSGPTAKPIEKIEMSRGTRDWLVEWKSLMACGTPGAKMVDDMALECGQHAVFVKAGRKAY